MSFIDHLEALRWHIIRAAIAVVVFTTAAFLAKDFLFHDLILGPSRNDFWTYRALCRLGRAGYSASQKVSAIGPNAGGSRGARRDNVFVERLWRPTIS